MCVPRPFFVITSGICLTLPYLRTTLSHYVVGGAGHGGGGLHFYSCLSLLQNVRGSNTAKQTPDTHRVLLQSLHLFLKSTENINITHCPFNDVVCKVL